MTTITTIIGVAGLVLFTFFALGALRSKQLNDKEEGGA